MLDAAAEAFAIPPGPLPVLRYPATALSAFLHDPGAFSRASAESATAAGAAREEDDDAAAFGTAGHELLEQLALSGWTGLSAAWLRGLGTTLDENALQDIRLRVERAAPCLAEQARGFEISTEWPFALKLEHGGVTLIVDGMADLILTRHDSRRVVDYKFTEDPPEALSARYGLQLNLYREAVARRDGIPFESVTASLLALRRNGIEIVDIPPDSGYATRAVEAARGLYELQK